MDARLRQSLQAQADRVADYLNLRVASDTLDLARLYRTSRDALVLRVRDIYDSLLWDDPTLVTARATGALDALEGVINETIEDLATQVGRTSVDRIATMIDMQPTVVNRLVGTRLFGPKSVVSAMEPSANTVLADLTTSVTGGGTYFDRLMHGSTELRQNLSRNIQSGLLNGSTFDQVRAKLMKSFGVDKLVEPQGPAYGAVKHYTNAARQQWNRFMAKAAEDLDGVEVWWAILDGPLSRTTTPGCAARHGRTIDALGETPPIHINCELPGSMVQGEFTAAFRMPYSGPAVELKTRRGYTLTVTAQHPILTLYGMLPAGVVQKGHYLLTYAGRREEHARRFAPFVASITPPDEQHVPLPIEQVFEALMHRRVVSISGQRVDFDGDAVFRQGDVDVAGSPRILFDDLGDPCLTQGQRNSLLEAPLLVSAVHQCVGDSRAMSPGVLFPASRRVHALDDALRVPFELPSDLCRVAPATDLDTALLETLQQRRARDARFAGQLARRYAALVQPDEVVHVRHFQYAGHVYDLQSQNTFIITDFGAITSNCRCTVAVMPEDTDLSEFQADADAWLKDHGYTRKDALAREAWAEEDHPRDESGKFADKGTGGHGDDFEYWNVSGSPLGGVPQGDWKKPKNPKSKSSSANFRIAHAPGLSSEKAEKGTKIVREVLAALPRMHLALLKKEGFRGFTIHGNTNRQGERSNGTYYPQTREVDITMRDDATHSVHATVAHEIGHAVDYAMRGGLTSYQLSLAGLLSKMPIAGEFVQTLTKYGTKDLEERFAEAYAMYASPQGRELMKVRAPETHARMQRLFESKDPTIDDLKPKKSKRSRSVTATEVWQEEDHPRDDSGKFTDSGSGGGGGDRDWSSNAPFGGFEHWSVSDSSLGGVPKGDWKKSRNTVAHDFRIATASDVTSEEAAKGTKIVREVLAALPWTHLALLKARGFRGFTIQDEYDRQGVPANGAYFSRTRDIDIMMKGTGRHSIHATVVHELGHALDHALRTFPNALSAGDFVQPLTKYGTTSLGERFAEAYAMYASPRGRALMKKRAPETHARMQRLFESKDPSIDDLRGTQATKTKRSKSVTATEVWQEEDHPRDDAGKFTDSGSGGGGGDGVADRAMPTLWDVLPSPPKDDLPGWITTTYASDPSGDWAPARDDPAMTAYVKSIPVTSEAGREGDRHKEAIRDVIASLPAAHVRLLQRIGFQGVTIRQTLNREGRSSRGTWYPSKKDVDVVLDPIKDTGASLAGVLAHELGHAIDQALGFQHAEKEIPDLAPVSRYGATSRLEGFAEAYAMYASPFGREVMQERHPKVYAQMDRLFKAEQPSLYDLGARRPGWLKTVEAYDPSQPRDESGKWSSQGRGPSRKATQWETANAPPPSGPWTPAGAKRAAKIRVTDTVAIPKSLRARERLTPAEKARGHQAIQTVLTRLPASHLALLAKHNFSIQLRATRNRIGLYQDQGTAISSGKRGSVDLMIRNIEKGHGSVYAVLTHELAHAIDFAIGYEQAAAPTTGKPTIKRMPAVTRYGQGDAGEAFAEAYAMYASPTGRVRLQHRDPETYRRMRSLFTSPAPSLKDLSPSRKD